MIDTEDYADSESTMELENMEIEHREEELDDAFGYLLDIVFDGFGVPDIEEMIIPVKEHLLKYLSEKFPDSDIYRPMHLIDDGELVYVEYPYEEYDIEES